MIILLPIFPTPAEAPLLDDLLSDTGHIFHSLGRLADDQAEIHVFGPDEAVLKQVGSVLPQGRSTVLEHGIKEERFVPRGTSACLHALGDDISKDHAVLVLNYRNALLAPETLKRAMEKYRDSNKAAISVCIPEDHPVQILVGEKSTGIDGAAYFDPHFRLPEIDTAPAREFSPEPLISPGPICTMPFPFRWHGYFPECFEKKLFAMLRHTTLPTNPILIPVESLSDYPPDIFSPTGFYFCESPETARRVFFHETPWSKDASVRGVSFFGSPDAPHLLIRETEAGMEMLLGEELTAHADRFKIARLCPDRGEVLDIPATATEPVTEPADASYLKGRHFSSLPKLEAVEGETGLMVTSCRTAQEVADLSPPAINESSAWSTDWSEGMPVNTDTGRTIMGRQDFPLIHSPCPAAAVGTTLQLRRLEHAAAAGELNAVPLSEAESLTVRNHIDLCRLKAFQGITDCSVDAPPPMPGTTPHAKTPPEPHGPLHVSEPSPRLMDMSIYTVDAALEDRFGTGNKFHFNCSVLRNIFEPSHHRKFSMKKEYRSRSSEARDLRDQARKELRGGDTKKACILFEKALWADPMIPGLHDDLREMENAPETASWAKEQLSTFNAEFLPPPSGVELGAPFIMTSDGQRTLYACGLGTESVPPRAYRIDAVTGESELMFEGVKYSSVTPVPGSDLLYGLRAERRIAECTKLDIIEHDGTVVETVDLDRDIHGKIRGAFFIAFMAGAVWINDYQTCRILALSPDTFRPLHAVQRLEFRSISQLRPHKGELMMPLPEFHSVCFVSPSGKTRFLHGREMVETVDMVHDPDESCRYTLQSCNPVQLRGHLCKMDENFQTLFQTNQNFTLSSQMHLLTTPGGDKMLATLDRENGVRFISLNAFKHRALQQNKEHR